MDDKPLLDLRRKRIVKGQGFYIHLSGAERLRIARRVPQAVVKVMSYAHGVKRVRQLMNYISREGKLELETESGELIMDRDQQKELIQSWSRDFDERVNSRDTAHLAFSMPPGSNPEALRNSVRQVGERMFPDNEWVFTIHQDRKHPHAHMVLKMRGRNKDKKLRLNKPELYQLREVFAEAAREQGVELAASPRAARGVGKKATRQAIYRLKEKGIRPEVEKQSRQEAIREITQNDWKEQAWEKAMTERNRLEREAYRREAKAKRDAAQKSQQQQERDRLLTEAKDLERFALEMPKPKTKQQATKERMWQDILQKRKEKARSQSKDRGMGLEL